MSEIKLNDSQEIVQRQKEELKHAITTAQILVNQAMLKVLAPEPWKKWLEIVKPENFSLPKEEELNKENAEEIKENTKKFLENFSLNFTEIYKIFPIFLEQNPEKQIKDSTENDSNAMRVNFDWERLLKFTDFINQIAKDINEKDLSYFVTMIKEGKIFPKLQKDIQERTMRLNNNLDNNFRYEKMFISLIKVAQEKVANKEKNVFGNILTEEDLKKLIDNFEETFRCSYEKMEKIIKISEKKMKNMLDTRNFEEVFRQLLSLNKNSFLNPLIEAIANKYIQEEEYDDDWSHSLCHLFENFKYPNKASFLRQDTQLIAEKLIVEETKRREKDNFGACFSRHIIPLLEYNLKDFDPQKIEQPFKFKPQYFIEETFLKNFQENYKDSFKNELLLFFQSKNLREFLSESLKFPKLHLEYFFPPKIMMAMLENLKDQNLAEQVLKQHFQIEENLKTVTKNIADSEKATEEEVVQGYFIDVEGTLIINKELNQKLHNTMIEYIRAGQEVIIFTGGNPEEQTKRLRELDVFENFLPVKSKNEFRGKKLLYLVDNTPPEYQGFKAKKYCSELY